MTDHSHPPIALIDDERFDAHEDSGGHHPECPERLAAARAGLFGALPDAMRTRLTPREATDDELAAVHDRAYLDRLRNSLRGGSGHLDPDTYFCPSTRQAAWLAAGGAIDLARTLVGGAAKQGVALLRPPGHHAVHDRSMGFCLLGNVALAARAALAAGLSRVAIVDWDVHHGNGTQETFYDDPRVLFVSLHQYPFYPGTGAPHEVGTGKGRGFTLNVAMPAGAGPEAYGAAFRELVLPVLRQQAPELLLVSAGFDAHARDPLASLELTSDSYGALTGALVSLASELGHGRLGLVLEGGYDLRALSESLSHVGHALLGRSPDLPEGKLHAPERATLEATRRALSPYWRLAEPE